MGIEISSKILLGLIILIPGYSEGPQVWDSWSNWLTDDNIPFHIVTFEDPCDKIRQHAIELENIINGSVNIVAHSKAGLDARLFIHENPNIVKNLVMIGTPNEGTTVASMEVTPCWLSGSAGREDLLDPNIPDSNKTNYYAVAGNYSIPCYEILFRASCYVTPHDGFVSVESALSHYKSLGVFHYNHNQLLTEKSVYDAVIKPIS